MCEVCDFCNFDGDLLLDLVAQSSPLPTPEALLIQKEVKAQEKVYEEKADKKAEYKAGELYRTRRLGKMKYPSSYLNVGLHVFFFSSLSVRPVIHCI